MDDFELPDDLKDDIEIIYSDGEDDDDGYDQETMEDMVSNINIEEPEEEILDVSQFTFTKHTKSIFSSSLSPNNQWACTGDESDTAFVWNTTTGDILFECTGHKDSVTEATFNQSGELVATADMAGMIQVWNLEEKKLLWCFEGEDLEWLEWHSQANNVLIAGFHTGDVYIWQIPQDILKVLPAAASATTCAKLLPNGKQILVGYDDGHLKLWDIKTTTVIWQTQNQETITSMDVNQDGTLAILAPQANLVKLLDGKQLCKLMVGEEREIEMGLFHPELPVIATGALSGHLCVWELARQTLRHEARIECAVTILKWGKNGKIFIGATDGAVYVCDVKSGRLSETLTGHRTEILSISVFSDGDKILTTSEDGTAKIFNIKP